MYIKTSNNPCFGFFTNQTISNFELKMPVWELVPLNLLTALCVSCACAISRVARFGLK